MNPQGSILSEYRLSCRGKQGKGNIKVHSRSEGRYICQVCEQTFSATKGTVFYRLRTDSERVMLVITLLAYGCPLQAIVKAFGFDERTVKDWQRSGEHCRALHEHLIEARQFDLQQVQADEEIKAKIQGGSLWMAMAMMVPTRLWLGGVISPTRDYALIDQVVVKVRRMALCRPLLLAVDGLVSYVRAFQNRLSHPVAAPWSTGTSQAGGVARYRHRAGCEAAHCTWHGHRTADCARERNRCGALAPRLSR